ncbi:PREDICTED: PRUPE_6G158100 [Prunus dulcis]|uniref:PREDICTED: PRUPE_6G158100 n=1 Tax=Prunus dulcis TaxID=3755 RepID=A0A5E4EZK6_PRUDU|nr:PREDICTED: PRUPE_6G158100 [Prunus dulcis]
MGLVKVVKSKENVYAVTMEDEAIASRLLEGNPWFVKGHVFTLKQWPLYCSTDNIEANRATFWIQAHGYQVMEGQKIHFKYEGLRNFSFVYGKLGNSRGCQRPPNPSFTVDGWGFGEEMRTLVISKASTSLFPSHQRKKSRHYWDNLRRKWEREGGTVQSHPLATTRSVSTSQSADLFLGTRSTVTSTCEKDIVNQEKVSTNPVKGTKRAKITVSPGRGNSLKLLNRG